jgi:hypothetical protein
MKHRPFVATVMMFRQLSFGLVSHAVEASGAAPCYKSLTPVNPFVRVSQNPEDERFNDLIVWIYETSVRGGMIPTLKGVLDPNHRKRTSHGRTMYSIQSSISSDVTALRDAKISALAIIAKAKSFEMTRSGVDQLAFPRQSV